MSKVSWLKQEWLQVLKNKKWMAAIIVILFIPSLYSGTYLWANWNPYAHLERLPVAVVNEDQPVIDNGKKYAIGKSLVRQLERDKSFQWKFISKDQAEHGLKNNHYYFEIYIPKDFSKNASTFNTSSPTPLNLFYKVNVGSNFLASQLGRTGVDKIRSNLSQSLSRNYAKMVFSSLTAVGKGMQNASQGAGILETDLKKTVSGTTALISNMNQQKQPIQSFSSSIQQLSGASDNLASGTSKALDGLGKIDTGMGNLENGLHSLHNTSSQLNQSLKPLSSRTDQFQESILALQKSHPEIKSSEFQDFQKKGKVIGDKANQFIVGVQAFNDGLGKSADSAAALHNGTNQLKGSLNSIASGASKLANSQHKLSAGAADISNGWDAAIQNLNKLKASQDQLTAGAGRLSRQLAEGAKSVGAIHPGGQIYSMMANPVHLKEKLIHNVPNYGTGLAPYFLSLSLFVGALLISTVFPIRETASRPPSALSWFLSKFLILAFVSVCHSLITNFILIHIVGLRPAEPGWLYAFTFFASLTFMVIIQFLATAADHAGRFVAIILLVLQLTASSGTFPNELTPMFMQRIHGLLPMTFTVQGFRAVISTGDSGTLIHDVLSLLPYLAAAVILTVLVLKLFMLKHAKALDS